MVDKYINKTRAKFIVKSWDIDIEFVKSSRKKLVDKISSQIKRLH